MSELFRALGALVEAPHPSLAPIACALDLGPLPTRAEHTEAIVFSLHPYASVYLGTEGMMGGEARDRVAGFFRAIGATVSKEPDHLAELLASYAAMSEREDLPNVQKALFWEHLMSFLPAYASAMQALGIDFYSRWATLLSEALRSEAARLGPPDRLPLHFAFTMALSASDDPIAGILAPVRSGMILVRRDVLRMARELGLGARQGERRWALSAMLSLDAPSVLSWLSAEARSWAVRHREADSLAVWAERAERTSDVLATFAREVHHVC